MTIKIKKTDVIWNYVGTIVSMSSGFILLPLLVRFLSGAELGLWYVYLAIANMSLLFEFGFSPTFARNIVYVISGARKLSPNGMNSSLVKPGIDWHLLNVVIRASKLIYALISCLVLLLLSTVGTLYISHISGDLDGSAHWIAWIVFCIAIFLNLYFLYSSTILRGYGDIAGENQASTLSRSLQIIFTGFLITCGFGLIGASIGYLINAIVFRIYIIIRLKMHRSIELGRLSDCNSISLHEIINILSTIFHLAWRDGIVNLSLYTSTQATSILCSFFLTLEQTGLYSVLLQFVTAICNFSSAYPRSFYPEFQACYTENNVNKECKIVGKSIVVFWFVGFICVFLVCLVVFPLIPLLKPNLVIDYPFFIFLFIYNILVQQYSIFCNYIVSMNEIPYMKAYLVAAILGCLLVSIFCGLFHTGFWGIVFGQFISQIYNILKWPVYLCKKIYESYYSVFKKGFLEWRNQYKKFLEMIL